MKTKYDFQNRNTERVWERAIGIILFIAIIGILTAIWKIL